MTKTALWIYITVSTANVISKIVPFEELDRFTKPLLMPILIFYVYRSSIGKTTMNTLLLSAALLFSWLGDISLIYQSNGASFMIGIGLFLIAQILYIRVLLKSSYGKLNLSIPQALPFILYASLLFYLLLPAGDFTLPIIIYGLVIIMMVIVARSRENNTSEESYRLALIGAIMFVMSDSFLAYDSFKSSIPYAGVLVMTTYCLAQLLLVQGILKHPA